MRCRMAVSLNFYANVAPEAILACSSHFKVIFGHFQGSFNHEHRAFVRLLPNLNLVYKTGRHGRIRKHFCFVHFAVGVGVAAPS